MNNLILNIAYSNTELPKHFLEKTFLNPELLEKLNSIQTEQFIDRIFGKNTLPKIIAPYSKLYCDILKDLDTCITTKAANGRIVIKPTSEYQSQVINEYYKPLHNRIEQSLSKNTSKGPTIFIDCHSHSVKDFSLNEQIADVCINVSSKYSKKSLNNFIIKFFEQHGYSVDFNNNFANVFIPNMFLSNNQPNLSIVRISLNQNLFLDNNQPNDNFKQVQRDIQSLLRFLKNLDFQG